MDDLKEILQRVGVVTALIREKFFPKDDYKVIRDKLGEMGLDRHMCIESKSTEIVLAVRSLNCVIMQVRPADNDMLGLWGGGLNVGESSLAGAIREFHEETKLVIVESDLVHIGSNMHYHKYKSTRDEGLFDSDRFVVYYENEPEIRLDNESTGIVYVTLENLPQYKEKMFSYQIPVVEKILNKMLEESNKK